MTGTLIMPAQDREAIAQGLREIFNSRHLVYREILQICGGDVEFALDMEREKATRDTIQVFKDLGRESPPTEADISSDLTNNFHNNLPGGTFRIYIQANENNRLDRNVLEVRSETERGSLLKLGQVFNQEAYVEESDYSGKYLTHTYREFYADIDQALVEAGMSPALMRQFETAQNTKAVIRRDREANFALIYKAFRILRHKGYDGFELL